MLHGISKYAGWLAVWMYSNFK